MPITPSSSWSETPAWVTVEVMLQSVSQASLDIVTTECYIKVNCLPYLFQADLHGCIDTHRSSAMVDNSIVRFFLVKKSEGLWERLTAVGDRKGILERRQHSLDAIRETAQKTKAQAGEKLAHIRRLAVGSQMKLEEDKRKTIEARKEAELKEERDALQSWKTELTRKTNGEQLTCTVISPSKDELLQEWNAVSGPCSSETDPKPSETDHRFREVEEKAQCAVEKLSRIQPRKLLALNTGGRIVPAPRKSFRVPISFTQKMFPNHLPARESREKELRLKKHAPVSSDESIDVSEREPLFLQDKGDKFFRSGDFKSAINAYTEALQRDSSLIPCYANRAACYLRTKQLRSSIDDCSTAIKLLKHQEEVGGVTNNGSDEASTDGSIPLQLDFMPVGTMDLLASKPVSLEGVEDWIKKAESCILLRRGSAKCHLGDDHGGLLDFQEALNVNPANEDIKRVLDCLSNKAVESPSSSGC